MRAEEVVAAARSGKPLTGVLLEGLSLRGAPSCKPTQGVTDSNRPQAERHCDYAIRAVRRAAPFKLPDESYNAWKTVRDVKFSGTL